VILDEKQLRKLITFLNDKLLIKDINITIRFLEIFNERILSVSYEDLPLYVNDTNLNTVDKLIVEYRLKEGI
jgi:hypothetical protein